MNDQQLENKIRKDTAKVRKDLSILAEDSAKRVSRFGNNVSQSTDKAKEGITTWVGENVSQLSERFDKLSGEAKEAVVGAATVVKKDVGHGLKQYNNKIQNVANQVPGRIGKMAEKYPWVTVSIALVIGLFLGSMLRHIRQPVAQVGK